MESDMLLLAGDIICLVYSSTLHSSFRWPDTSILHLKRLCYGETQDDNLELETATRTVMNRNPSKAETVGFVLWKMNHDMWYVALPVGGNKVPAGCNGKFVWRHTTWLGSHTAKGPVRALRRGLQGIDLRNTATMFAEAKCIGEKKVNGEDFFILKLCTETETLKAWSVGPAEIIRHILFGYFSQKTGLLVHIEDSHLIWIQSNGGDTAFWETTYNSSLDNYRQIWRSGDEPHEDKDGRKLDDEVAFNVPGLSLECFIPPADLKSGSITHSCEYPHEEREKNNAATLFGAHMAKDAPLENGSF